MDSRRLQSRDIRGDGLREPFLQGTAVVYTAAYFGDQGLGKVKGEGAPWEATVEHVTEVLFCGKAGVAVLAPPGTTSPAQGGEGGGPQAVHGALKPALPIGGRLGWRLHAV